MADKNKESASVYINILDRCKKVGISVSELSRRSGVKRQVFANWKNNNPKSLNQFLAIEKELDSLEAEKEKERTDKLIDGVIEKTDSKC